jgi:hypothetical protein
MTRVHFLAGEGREFSSLLLCLDQVWGPSSLQFSGFWGLFLGGGISGKGMKLTTRLNHVEVKNVWSYTFTHLCIFMVCAWIGTQTFTHVFLLTAKLYREVLLQSQILQKTNLKRILRLH